MNGYDNIVKLLSAARCCAKAIIDVTAVKFSLALLNSVRFLDSL